MQIQFEADEAEPEFGKERLDLTQRQVLLLHVESQVTTITHRIERVAVAQRPQLNARVLDDHILAESTDVIGCACITACGNEFARLDHGPTRKLAVQAQTHESSGPQSRQQDSPSIEGVGQMVQHSN